MLISLQNRVIEICIKHNHSDLLNDLPYFTDMQLLGAYFMLERLHGG